MSNGNHGLADAEAEALFNVEKIYTKDVSFENPNSPQVFLAANTDPKVELKLNIGNRQIDDDHWEVSLKVSILTRSSKDDRVMFEIEVEQAAVFLLKNIPVEHLPVLLGVDCPSIIFPYTRQIVSQLTSDGGFSPLLLAPFNFTALYQESSAQQPQTPN
jgi:preprotein translocase subunit SecB